MGGRPWHCAILAALLSLFPHHRAGAARAESLETADLSFGLGNLETADLRLIYFRPAETFLIPHAARSFHTSMQLQRDVFNYVPAEKVTVVLKDFSDYGNAAARANPRNALLLDIAPFSRSFETFSAGERLYTLMNHELVHVTTMDQAAPEDERFRSLFGGKVRPIADHPETILYSYLTTPRTAVPRWYLEGVAVFMETWMAGGLGRAQGPYDEMVFRAMVRDDAHFYDRLGLVSEGTKVDFQVGVNAYLYGTRFISYLAYAYSPQDVIAWVARTEGSKRHYADHFEKVFGETMDQVWADWIEWEHQFQSENLASIRENPITQPDNISPRALGSVSRAYHDPESGKMYAAIRYPGVVAHLAEIDIGDGSVRKLGDIKGPMLYRVTSLAHDPASDTLFYTTDNYQYRDIMALDIATGETRELLEGARIGDLAFNRADRSLWGIRHLNGIATIVRIPYPYDEFNQVYSFPYGRVPYDLDISPDGTLASFSLAQINGDQSLKIIPTDRLLADDLTPIGEFNFGLAVPESFVFSADGKYLYGSSYYTGVSNIFRYEIGTQEIDAVSNAETGFFRPVPLSDGSLIVFNYTGQGFVPAFIDPVPLEDVSAARLLGTLIANKHPVVRDWQVQNPGDVDLDQHITEHGDYQSLSNVGLESIYPVVEGYKDSYAIGVRVNISDPISFDELNITASYSPDDDLDSDEKTHVHVKYRHRAWTAQLKYNDADFYDLFGPTEVSRKGYSAELGYDRPLIWDEPRRMDLSFHSGYYGDLERLPNAQNVFTQFDEFFTAQARLDYTDVRSSLGHVDDEKGHKWNAILGFNHVDSETIPYLYGAYDFGFALPLHHSSIWLRNSAGIADGDRDNPFANFFFGGFGNNYVDHREVKRYREHFRLPGFEIDEIGGQTFARSILEWNLPPIRFRKLGTPEFYVTWARPAIFASALRTDWDDSALDETFSNIGAQVDFQFQVLSYLDMTLSIGYAKGFGNDDPDEFMLSLKIM